MLILFYLFINLVNFNQYSISLILHIPRTIVQFPRHYLAKKKDCTHKITFKKIKNKNCNLTIFSIKVHCIKFSPK